MTLTELNYYVRKFTPLGVIFFLVVLMIFLAVQLIFLYLNSQQSTQVEPTQKATIDTAFNNIGAPIIPQARSSDAYTYVIDTLDGTPNVENATEAATVYFIPKATASFGSLSTVSLMAKEAGFDTEVTQPKISDNVATFDDGKKKLVIDMASFNFSFDYVLTQEDINFDSSDVPSERDLTSRATAFFSNLDRYPQELAKGTQNIMYMNFNAGSKEIQSLETSEGANMAEIDFYRPDINGYPVVTSTYYNSPHYVLIGFSPAGDRIVRAQVKLYEISKDQIGQYPLRTAELAFGDLQAGKGLVVSSTQEAGQVTIKKVFLAYYDPDVYQEYFQPVYVFLGDNNYVGYVPAVTEQYIQQ